MKKLPTHLELTVNALRPSGMEPVACETIVQPRSLSIRGRIFYQVQDDAQPNEGRPGEKVLLQVFECPRCRCLIPAVTLADGRQRIRNQYPIPGA